MNKDVGCAELVQAVRENNLETRYDVVCYCVGFYGEVNSEILDVLNKLFVKGFVKA